MKPPYGPADEAAVHEFAMGVTAPEARRILAEQGLGSALHDDVLDLAERYLYDPATLDRVDLQRLRDAATSALPSHDEQFCSYWWATTIFGPLARRELAGPPELSDGDKRELLMVAHDLTQNDDVLQRELDRVGERYHYDAVPAEDSPYTIVWAIVDKRHLSSAFERLRAGLSPQSMERFIAWAAGMSDAEGVRCPPP
jgi:hypothetical protein